jgi:hypothetical protein
VNAEEEAKLAAMTPAERKKYKAKLKKKDKKKSDKEKEANAEDAEQSELKVDEDPEGLALLACSEPLAEANKWCELLLKEVTHSATPLEAETYGLVSEVLLRRQEYMACVKILASGLALYPHHPTLIVMLTKFSLHIQSISSPSSSGSSSSASAQQLPAQSTSAISEALTPLLQGHASITAFIDHYSQHCVSSVTHRVGAAQALLLCTPTDDTRTKVVQLLSYDKVSNGKGVSVKSLESVLQFLTKECRCVSGCVDAFTTAAGAKFPLAPCFGGPGYAVRPMEEVFSIAPHV